MCVCVRVLMFKLCVIQFTDLLENCSPVVLNSVKNERLFHAMCNSGAAVKLHDDCIKLAEHH